MKQNHASYIVSIVSLLTAAAGETRNITILEFVNTTGDESGTPMTETTRSIIASSAKFSGIEWYLHREHSGR